MLPANGFTIIKTEKRGIRLFTNSNLGPRNQGTNLSEFQKKEQWKNKTVYCRNFSNTSR